MKKKIFLSVGLTIALTPLGAYGGHDIKLFCSMTSFCILTFILLKGISDRTKIFQTCLIMALPSIILYSPAHLIHFEETRLSLPSSLASVIGIACGASLHALHNQRLYRYLLVSVYAVSVIVLTFWGYPLWLQKLNFGTFSGQTNELAPAFEFTDVNGCQYSNKDFKNKTVILDFWTTSCGVCFIKFPHLEKLSDKFKNRTDIAVYAVNVPLKRNIPDTTEKIIRERNYDFNVLFANSKLVNNIFSIEAYPTTLVLVNGERIIFRGDVELVDSFIKF